MSANPFIEIFLRLSPPRCPARILLKSDIIIDKEHFPRYFVLIERYLPSISSNVSLG